MNVPYLKIAVIVLNVVLLLSGIVIAALGIWVLAVDYGISKLAKIKEDGFYSHTLDEPGLLESAAVICIVVGVFMIILSTVGFCGVRKESKCYLATCSALLAALIVLDVVVIILTAISNQRTEKHLERALMEGVVNHYDSLIDSQLRFSVYFDRAQVQLECCGVVSYTDFRDKSKTWTERTEFLYITQSDQHPVTQSATMWMRITRGEIPRTCCFMNSRSSYLHSKRYDLVNVTCPRNLVSSHLQPCASYIKDWLMEKTTVLLAVAAAIAGLKLIAIIMEIVFFHRLKEDTPYNDM